MRVLARLHAYVPEHGGGAEVTALTPLRELVARGPQLRAWLSPHTARREPSRADVGAVTPATACDEGVGLARDSDVVVSHLENVRAAAAAARGWGRPLVVLCHNTFPATFRAVGSGTTALAVYNSQWMAAEAERWFAENPKAARPLASVIVR